MSTVSSTATEECSHVRAFRNSACSRCREKKIRCDVRIPRCGACLKANSECVLSSVTNDRVYDRRYIGELHRSIQTLQAELDGLDHELRHRRVRSNSSLPGERSLLHAISSPAEPTEQTAIPRLSRDSRHSENFGADPDIATTTESLVSLSKMNDRGKGDLLNSRLLLSQILGTTGRNPYETSSTQVGAGDFFLQTVPESIPASLSRFLSIHADTLVSRYEAQIHANYPFLDMAVMKLTTSTFQNPATASPEIRPRGYERFLVLMACAIALVLDNRDIPFADHFETQLIFSTLGDVSRILETSKPLEEIHISLLIAFYSLYRPSLGSSWHYIGLALRTCVAQGYHTKRAVCNAKDEPAKLTFWSCFALAQECSRALGRPNMLTSIDISTPLIYPGTEHGESWVSFQWLLLSLDSKPGSALHCIRTLYSWRIRHPKTQSLSPATQELLDEAYLMAIIDRSTLDYSSWSIPVAQIVFLASVCLINRIASVKTLSWVSGVRTFRAGLLCISSAVFLQSLHTQSTATQQLGHTIEKCCRTLAQLAISFTDLSMHSSILSQLLRDISSGNPIPEELFQSLRTSDEQKSARQIMQWLQGNPGIEVTDQALSQHLFMLFNVLGHMNDDEKALRDFLFN